jgi:hypothetical protein
MGTFTDQEIRRPFGATEIIHNSAKGIGAILIWSLCTRQKAGLNEIPEPPNDRNEADQDPPPRLSEIVKAFDAKVYAGNSHHSHHRKRRELVVVVVAPVVQNVVQ